VATTSHLQRDLLNGTKINMSINSKLDNIDRKILEILQLNGKITNSQLALEIGLSPAPTLERVRKLENLGILQSYHALLDKKLIGLGVTIFIQVSLSSHKKHQIKSFVDKMNAISQVIECHHITGTADFILKVVASDITSYQSFLLDKLLDVEEIGNMQSMIVLSTYKDSKTLPILD
jgi:DNA-binding Lrp family transcriptional regulator